LGGGHALWAADLDGDGDEELAVGWRERGQGDFAQPGVAVFDPGDWGYQIVDAGGMATEDLTIADLNKDGRADIIAGGRATSNVKIYWNEAQERELPCIVSTPRAFSNHVTPPLRDGARIAWGDAHARASSEGSYF
jgi:hypothetical protein